MEHGKFLSDYRSKGSKLGSSKYTWWNSEGGPKEVLALAWPMMLSTGLFSITLFVDRLLLYTYADSAAAGAMGAGTMFWAVTCGPVALLSFTGTFTAQYVGVNRVDRAIEVVIQGLILAVLLGPFVLLCAWAAEWYFHSQHATNLANLETAYFRWVSVGAWATILTAPINGLFAGTGRTRTLLLVDAVTTAFNATLDYLLIFGIAGLPEMGVRGAALATSLALLMKLALMFYFAGQQRWAKDKPSEATFNEEVPRGLFTHPWRLDAGLMKRLIYYGWPASISSIVEALSFTMILMLLGHLGETPMAATMLALGVNMLAFIPMIGLGQAVGVLVGQRLTGGRTDLAKRSVRVGLVIGIIYTSIFAITYGLFPDPVLSIYGWGVEPARFSQMKPMVVPLLWFIAVYCVFDAIQIVLQSALRGAGDTAYILLSNMFCGFGCVAIGAILGKQVESGLYWWWGVMTAWVIALAAVFSVRYLHGGWQKKRVIEPDLLSR